MNPRFSILAIPLLLAACTFAPVTDENSPDSKIPVGSKLILKRNIVVSGNSFFGYLATRDKPNPALDKNEIDTRCILEMRNRIASDRTIEPTEFQVSGTEDKVDYTLRDPIQVAVLKSGQPALEDHITRIYLQSSTYPDVNYIECQRAVEYGFGFPLSVTTLRWAIGGHFDLVVAKNIP